MGKVIMIKNNKGGVGKTFVTSQLAHLFSHSLGKKVLIVTTDSQNNILHFMGKSNAQFNNGLETWIKTGDGDIIELRNNLYFIPLMADYIKPSKRNKDKLKVFFDSQREIYDYIFIDATPTLSLDEEFLNISDKIIIPTFCDSISTDSISNLLEKITDKTKIKAVVPNKFTNTKAEIDHSRQLKEIFGYYDIMLANPIFQTALIAKTVNKGKTIWEVRTKKIASVQEVFFKIAELIL